MSKLNEELVKTLSERLRKRSWQLASVESCTGGGLSFLLTSLPGSSFWFERGFVTYSNQSKIDMVGVREMTLLQHGAVSEVVAYEMALGALLQSHASVSVAITGIAGPEGGTETKPVGTVWIATAKETDEAQAQLYQFNGDRASIREQAITAALQQLLTVV